MLDETGAAEITYRSAEWAADVFRQWLGVNQLALRMQESLPDEIVGGLPHDWRNLAAGIALRVHGDTIAEGLVILEMAVRVLDGFLEHGSASHPSATITATTGVERGAVAEEDVRAELAVLRSQVERNGRDLNEILRLLADGESEGSPRSAGSAA